LRYATYSQPQPVSKCIARITAKYFINRAEECSSTGRAPVSKTGGWGFEPLHSCQSRNRGAARSGPRFLYLSRSLLNDGQGFNPAIREAGAAGGPQGHLAIAQGDGREHRDGDGHGGS